MQTRGLTRRIRTVSLISAEVREWHDCTAAASGISQRHHHRSGGRAAVFPRVARGGKRVCVRAADPESPRSAQRVVSPEVGVRGVDGQVSGREGSKQDGVFRLSLRAGFSVRTPQEARKSAPPDSKEKRRFKGESTGLRKRAKIIVAGT